MIFEPCVFQMLSLWWTGGCFFDTIKALNSMQLWKWAPSLSNSFASERKYITFTRVRGRLWEHTLNVYLLLRGEGIEISEEHYEVLCLPLAVSKWSFIPDVSVEAFLSLSLISSSVICNVFICVPVLWKSSIL